MGICHWILGTGLTFLLSTAEISQKHIYNNGIKEFTVTKEIKRNDCACACTCVPDGLPFGSPAPPPPAPDNTAPQKFVITKQFKDNLCSCSCTCSPKEAAAISVATLLTTIAAVTTATPPSPVKSMATTVEDRSSVASAASTATSTVPSGTTLAEDSRRVPEDNRKKVDSLNFEESNDDKRVTARPGPDKQVSLASWKPVATRTVSTATVNDPSDMPSSTEPLESATTIAVANNDGSKSTDSESRTSSTDTPGKETTTSQPLPSSISAVPTANDLHDVSSSTEPLESATTIPVGATDGSKSGSTESRSSSTATPGRETSAPQALPSSTSVVPRDDDERTYTSTVSMPTVRPSESSASTSSTPLPAVGSSTLSTSGKASDEIVKESEATTQQGIETSAEEDDRMTEPVSGLPTTAMAADVMHLATTAADAASRKTDVPAATISPVTSSASSQVPTIKENSPSKATRPPVSGTTVKGSTPDQQAYSSASTSVSNVASKLTEASQATTAHGSTAIVGSALLSTTETSTASDIEESNLDEIATEIEQTADLVTTSAPGDSTPSEPKETTSGEHAKAAEEFKSKAMDLLSRLRETVARARVNLHPDNITTSRQDLTTLAAERTTKSEPTIGATTTDLPTPAPSSDELVESTSVSPSPKGREAEFRTKAASLLERLQKKLDDLRSKAKESAVNTSTAQSVRPVERVTEADASSSARVHLSSSEPGSSQATDADGPLASSATSETTNVFVTTASSVASTASTRQSAEAGNTWSTHGSTAILQEDSDVVTGTNETFSNALTASTTASSSQSVHGEQSTENSKGAATLNAQSTSTTPSTPSSSSEPTLAEDHWGSTTDTSITETTLITHDPLTPTPSATVRHPVTTTELPSATTEGSSLETTASPQTFRADPDTETAGTSTATEHRQQRTSRVSAVGTTPEPISSDETTAESSISVSPTAKVQSTTAKRPTQPSFAFVTAPPENGSLSTNAEVVQSITTHLLMTLSRALSTQTTTENSREASTNAESDLEHVLESVLIRDSQSTANTSASTGNSFVQGIGNGGTTVPIRTSARIQPEQPTTAGNGNDIQTVPDSAPAENQFDSQSTSADVASAVDGDMLTLDKVETPVLGVKDANTGRDSDSSNVFMPTRFEIPSSRILEERLEQARRLREEQRRLEMLASIQKEANFQSQQDRRREIEEKLAQLAESERWHRELLQRARLQQRIMANGGDETKLPEDKGNEVGSETNSQHPASRMVTPLSTTIATAKSNDATDRCAPVQRFVQVFHVKDPHQWLRENCVFIKQYFPAASCLQIQTLLATCFANITPTTESPTADSS